MKKLSLAISAVLTMMLTIHMPCEAKNTFKLPQKDSRELQFQDMLMLFLLPHIDKAVGDYYSKILTENPTVYPYYIDVVKSERVNGFRGFDFLIIVDVIPTVGPHIDVGKDRITFEVSAGPNVELINYTHLETHKLPSNWQHIFRKS